ncbi:Crp/Fnr family transcriptional regulator [Indioceanicola profundi]|uniref:Crp/Fnr family transcriptional regulator n=1 Tax=Indioceanicola profundi TaxID=2220096 RepID=UPI000E6AAF57|nr:Crp/Fnr family transcriptional regulator [Indioceanicola profundi]
MPHSISSAPGQTCIPLALQNHILRALPEAERDRLLSLLEPVELRFQEILHEAGEPIRHVYFVEDGVVSQLAMLDGDQEIEVGLIGREGLAGFALALGSDAAHTEAMVQMSGHAYRMTADAFCQEMARSSAFSSLVLRFVQTMYVQAGQGAACNGSHPLGERLARWLLEMHDRVGADTLPVTSEIMALMLGVRRPALFAAVGCLERAGIISQDRSSVTILERAQLAAASCACYQVIRHEADRMLG